MELQELYQSAIDAGDLSSSDLVERIAQRFVYAFSRLYSVSKSRVHVFAGPESNGAYALAIARLLREKHYRPEVYLFFRQGKLSDECEEQRHRLGESDVPLHEVTMEFRMPIFSRDEVIIDGLFGGDITRPLSGGYLSVVDRINQSQLPVVSIELPSGMYAENNSTNTLEHVVRATHTIAFESPYLVLLMADSAPYVGQWQVLPVGIGEAHHCAIRTRYYLLSDQVLMPSLLGRSVFAQKRDYGKALIVGGSRTNLGGLLLALRGSLRTGVGQVHTMAPTNLLMPIQIAQPEVMCLQMDRADWSDLGNCLRQYQSVAIGTAMMGAEMTVEDLRQFLSNSSRGIILDDWAMEQLINHRSLLDVVPSESVLLLSQGDQEKLFGEDTTTLDRLEAAKELATRLDSTVVLKGAYTTVCRSSDYIYFNTTGNAALAKAGSGHILTGLIAGLTARGYSVFVGTLLAIYLHGLASDICVVRQSAESVLPSDIIEHIGEAMRQLYPER